MASAKLAVTFGCPTLCDCWLGCLLRFSLHRDCSFQAAQFLAAWRRTMRITGAAFRARGGGVGSRIGGS